MRSGRRGRAQSRPHTRTRTLAGCPTPAGHAGSPSALAEPLHPTRPTLCRILAPRCWRRSESSNESSRLRQLPPTTATAAARFLGTAAVPPSPRAHLSMYFEGERGRATAQEVREGTCGKGGAPCDREDARLRRASRKHRECASAGGRRRGQRGGLCGQRATHVPTLAWARINAGATGGVVRARYLWCRSTAHAPAAADESPSLLQHLRCSAASVGPADGAVPPPASPPAATLRRCSSSSGVDEPARPGGRGHAR